MPIVDASAREASHGSSGIPTSVGGMSIDGQGPFAHPADAGAVDRAVSTAIAYTGHVSPTESLLALKKEAADMKTAKKALGAQIRNAKRKNKRLKEKAKNLSTEDLMTLWMAKGGGKQSNSEANASAAPQKKTSFSDDTSEMMAAEAACIANNAPARMIGEQMHLEI
jgi:hypothetical protein